MRIDVRVDPASLRSVQAAIDKISGPQLRQATAKALNDTGFHVRRAMQAKLKAFDRPTAYIVGSPLVDMATPENLQVAVRIADRSTKSAGVSPEKILQAQAYGGRRADKRSEVALRRHGFLPPGYQTAIPETPFPGSDDGRGNLRGPFLMQLLSYLRAGASEGQGLGYTSNMSDKRRRAIHKGSKKAVGRRYFVAGGRTMLMMDGGDRSVMRTGSAGRTSHLPIGVWASVGGEIKPVLMFVKMGVYKPRIDTDDIARESGAQEYLDRRLRFRIRQAAGL